MLVCLLSHEAKDKKAGDTSKLLEPPKARGYQVDAERCLWQRFELWNGKQTPQKALFNNGHYVTIGNNPRDGVAFEKQLKWATSSQGPTPASASAEDQGTDKVQRLNASGPDAADHCT